MKNEKCVRFFTFQCWDYSEEAYMSKENYYIKSHLKWVNFLYLFSVKFSLIILQPLHLYPPSPHELCSKNL